MPHRPTAYTVLTALLLTAIVPAVPAGGGGSPLPCQLTHDLYLSEDSQTILMGPEAQQLGFLPACVTIDSGGTLTFASVDATIHPLATTSDAGECWRHTYQPGETGEIQLSYEDGVVHVDGEPCPGVATETTDTYALVEFDCVIHPLMQLDVVVTASGP